MTSAQQALGPAPERLLSMRQVIELTRYSRPSIYRLMKDEAFPRPWKMTPGGKVLFGESEVRTWLASRPRAL
jgi:predicted DNA-binding transcriptional regulator AlpA